MQPYKKLFTYWFSVIIYDLTVEFTKTYIKSYKLTDQMNGAARSGKQNIVEGSDAMQVSVKSAIKLTGVSKASIEELTGDLEDFLRQNKLEQWGKNVKKIKLFRAKAAKLVRSLAHKEQDIRNLSNLREHFSKEKNAQEDANLILTLCHQATYLLHRQILSLEQKHRTEGGLTEKLYKTRKEYRGY